MLIALLAMAAPLGAAEGRVKLELVREAGFPLTGAQQWLRLLSEVKAGSVRIRQLRSGDRVATETRGSKAAPVYHVTGVLTARNTLKLPGATFSLRDRARLADWLRRTAAGPQDPAKRKTSFGLTDAQLGAATRDLSAKVDFKTKDTKLAELIKRIGRKLQHPLAIDRPARRALAVEDRVRDELEGLSSGTTLAAALRPMGLVLVPRAAGASHEYAILSGKGAKQIWPIGWPADKPSAKLVPNIVKVINIQLEEAPLAKTLAALQPRLEVPFLLDHNSLAAAGIDPGRTTVSLPKARSTYGRILRRSLYQAKMKYELRIDDGGKPFFWMTTLRRRK